MAALEKELERYRQAERKSESAQQETDAPTKAACKMAIKALGQLQTTGLFADDHPAGKGSDESVPLSNRIRAGQNQIAMHERDLKAANDGVQEAERSIVAAQKSLEQHRAKVEDIEKRAAAKEAAARSTKEARELDEFGSLDDQDDPTPDPTPDP